MLTATRCSLPGQEFGAGNHRAFAALDPCKRDGELQKEECASLDERCASDADCCPPGNGQPPNACIAGFCAFIPLN